MKRLRLYVRRKMRSLLWRLICKLFPDKASTFRLPDGSRFFYPIKSAVGYGLFIGAFEAGEITFLRQSIAPGDIVFDVGANGGLFTVIAARQVAPAGHVYSFEPGKRELELLQYNIALNGLKNVTIIPSAVSNTNGTAPFAISHDGAMNSLRSTNHPGQKIEEWQTVQLLRLDDFVKEKRVERVDFIKIDVEGAEKFVLEGALELLRTDKGPTVLFESYNLNTSGFGYSARDLVSQLQGMGLPVYYVDDTGALQRVSTETSGLGHEIYSLVIQAGKSLEPLSQ